VTSEAEGSRRPWSQAADRLSTRAGQVWGVFRRDGLRVIAGQALVTRGSRLLAGARPTALDVRPVELVAPPRPVVLSGRSVPPLTINWITNPPTEPSGGMGTLMRCVELLESRGHDCRIYVLYKGYRRDLEHHRLAARERFPAVKARVESFDSGLRDADAVFATGWPTAYASRASAAVGGRFYLVQDFEPAFYAASSNATLAEETYRFGFHGLTAGPWLATKLARDYGMPCDYFDLGVDLGCYQLGPPRERSGVVFYARPDTPRRGFEIGMMALELFARRHPEIEIHLVGQDIRARRPSFPFTNHGHLSAAELAAVYQRCVAGLVLSLTNLSLLPNELLATGCIPVMNDAENTRASCDNPYARFAGAMPDQLAAELGSVVEAPGAWDTGAKAAACVAEHSWDNVADQLEAGLRRGLELMAQGDGP
jgi:O-antigen biosynthesis protein